MADYIRAIKRELRDKYGFRQISGTEEDPVLENIPDGKYPITIDKKEDLVFVKNNRIYYCNLDRNLIERSPKSKIYNLFSTTH